MFEKEVLAESMAPILGRILSARRGRDASARLEESICPGIRQSNCVALCAPYGRPSRTRYTAVRMMLAAVLTLAVSESGILLAAKNQDEFPLLTQVAQIRKLTADEARLGYPVELRGVITFDDSRGGTTFFQDSTAGIFLNTTGVTKLHPGDLVEIRGMTGPGEFAPVVENPQFRVVGQAPLPIAHRFPLEDLLTGEQDSQWVEVRGIVRSVSVGTAPGFLVLGIAAGGNKFVALITEFNRVETYASLVDAAVAVRGACGTVFNDKRQLVGIQLFVPGVDQVHINQAVPRDPFALPIVSANSLMRFTPEKASGHRIRVQGMVTLDKPGRFLFVQDATGGIYVVSSQSTAVQPGDRVDAVGFPTAGQYAPILEDGQFRRIGRGRMPIPIDLTGATSLNGDPDAQLVKVRGQLLDKSSGGENLVLTLQMRGYTFTALLDNRAVTDKVASIPEGSQLQMTGVWSVGTDEYRNPKVFRVLLRSARDIVILEWPSWWTSSRILVLLAILGGIILSGALWVTTLRRRINERAETIRAALESTADGILVVDSAGKIVAYNHKFAEMWGIPESVLKSRDDKKALDFVLAQLKEPETFLTKVQELYSEGEAQSDDVIEFKDGRVFERHSEPQVVKGESMGRVWGFRDVTQRRRAETELQESEEYLKAILGSIPTGILVINAETHEIVDINPFALQMFGSPRERVVGHLCQGFVCPAELGKCPITDLHQTVDHSERILLTATGKQVPILKSVRPLTRKGHTYLIEALVDITDHKQAEAALARERNLLRTLIDYLPDFIYVKDTERRFLIANKSLAGFLGVSSPEELLGKTVFDLYPEEIARACDESDQAVLRTGHPLMNFEDTVYDPTGRTKWVLTTLVPLRDGQGNVEAFVGIDRNITDRKRVEEELERAKATAEAASRAKSEFLANMSHEIRTPMNGIMGMVELALDTELTAEQSEYLRMVKTSADALLTVINEVLDFSRIEAGKLDMDPIPFQLRDSLVQTLKQFAVQAHQKGLELTCDVRPDVPEEIVADPTRFRQIIVNLVGNAIKFTEQGEIGLEVEVESKAGNQVQLHFVVRDTGIGIAPDKQSIIFEAFSQADGSTVRKYGGSGLGLTISSRLVEMMHGRIWVESQPGQGSCFHFTVQVGRGETLVLTEPVERGQLVGVPVLVVDDNATNRRIMGEMLERWQIKPVLAASGSEALKLLQEATQSATSFALLLTDAHMPGMDGWTLVERVRQIADLTGTTIMMLTSAGERGDAARCRQLGIAAYLIKPIGQSQLLDAILNVLGTRAQQADQPRLVTRHSLREKRRNLHILVAEDNLINQKLAARLIEKRGHTAVIVSNGREALDALEKQTFDLMLVDVQMPEMDGFEATAAIREKEKNTGLHLPIIAMTAHAMKGDQERCLSAGMDDYVSKPIQPEVLFKAVEGFIPKPYDL